jgi:hypothetical protein
MVLFSARQLYKDKREYRSSIVYEFRMLIEAKDEIEARQKATERFQSCLDKKKYKLTIWCNACEMTIEPLVVGIVEENMYGHIA